MFLPFIRELTSKPASVIIDNGGPRGTTVSD